MRYLKGDIKWLGENIESRGQRPECVPPRQAMAVFTKDFLHRQAYDYLDRGDLGPAFTALAGNVGLIRRRLSSDQPATPIGRPGPTGPGRSGAVPSAEVVVIGAGPNGLSVSAHLRHAGIEHRVFGQTMGAWRFNMPAGMMLKSEPYASDLSTPEDGYLARDYCAQANEVYHERVIPLSREQFVGYGTWFASQVVPDLEETEVTSVTQSPNGGFQLRTAEGEHIRAARVVVATGIIPFAYVPPVLSSLPADLVSHTSQHRDLAQFRGKEVLIVGGGSSALETSALLHELGAAVKLVMRGDGASWPAPNPEKYPTRLEQVRRPVVRLCEGWPCWGYDRLPDVFRLLPKKTRLEHALGFLGPAGAWWLRDRVEGKVPMLLDQQVLGAEAVGDRVQLHLRGPEGVSTECADHVIAGTGFRFDMSRLEYLDPSLRAHLELMGGAPVLNHSLESNVPGLFFTGALAAPSMGPLMRFVAGTHFIGPRLVHGLSAKKRRNVRPKSNPNWQSIQPSNGNGTAPGGLEKEAMGIETNEHIA
jgi:FAD-dependent urate hydroxylase